MQLRVVLALATTVLAFLWSADGLVAGHDVVKRSDDTDPLNAVVSGLTQDLTAVKAQIQSLLAEQQAMKNQLGKKVAVKGILPAVTIAPNAPIHFTVVDRTGSGYDATTGVFTAPYSGWYTVDFQLFPSQTLQVYFNVDLIHNGNMVARARCTDVSGDTTTCNSSVTQHVNAGDRLWVQTDAAATVHLYATPFDSFLSIALVSLDG